MSFAPQNSFSETTSQSWLGRLWSSIKGVLFGLIFFIAAFPLLWWNEGRAVRTSSGLHELSLDVVSVKADKVDPANNGRPVHITAQAASNETLNDPDFNVSTQAIKLARRVSMYQWQEHKHTETKKKLGGGTETITTYTYDKGWPGDSKVSGSSQPTNFQWGGLPEGAVEVEDSRKFKHPEGHENPIEPKFRSLEKVAQKVAFGAFTLSPGLVGQLNSFEDLPLGDDDLAKIPENVRNQVKLEGSGLYLALARSRLKLATFGSASAW